ncbi:MAG: DUF1592 domain-containing protein [Aureliella sp.]
MLRMPFLAVFIVTSALTMREEAYAVRFDQEVGPLLKSSCIYCHDQDSDNGLDLESLAFSIADVDGFARWEQIYDRIESGEMPPESEERPDSGELRKALRFLQAELRTRSQELQIKNGRLSGRRLTKLELGFTLKDLLGIDEDVTVGVPDEAESGSFDTVGAAQRISAVHIESYFAAADQALERAIQIGRNPYKKNSTDYGWLAAWHEKPLNQGGSVTSVNPDGGIILFRDIDYLTHFQFQSFNPYGGPSASGLYRLTARVGTHQSDEPLTVKLIIKGEGGSARLATAVDIEPGDSQEIEVEAFLQPGDKPYLTFVDPVPPNQGVFAAGGAQHYKGPCLAIFEQTVEGPLTEEWPPKRTTDLLVGLEVAKTESLLGKIGSFLGGGNGSSTAIAPSKEPMQHVAEVVNSFAPRAFRRPVTTHELEPFIDLAKPAVEQGRPLVEAIRISLRGMLASPQFLMMGGDPGALDDFALASRLSYFLWRSLPDDELRELAQSGKLKQSNVLRQQVDRMLADAKSERFVDDFLGQWLTLHKVNATTPDDGLYPEFDELLANSIPQETKLFFAELIDENLPARNLIDSDFTMLNRRLAEHYGIEGVEGQQFRRVALDANSPRGGVLTQAAILKTTANGTNTSPVMRGNFVLTNFMGTPPAPPPPDVGSIEPDTRGKTTIREVLAAHREIESCNQCHRHIDPPGFALESFDPVGGFRTHYRVSGGVQSFGGFINKLPPKQGLPVDPSGVTADGDAFDSIANFKKLLLAQEELIVRNLVSQFVVFSTGAEIQFADRDELDAIMEQTRDDGFQVRDLIHAVIQSSLFRNQ